MNRSSYLTPGSGKIISATALLYTCIILLQGCHKVNFYEKSENGIPLHNTARTESSQPNIILILADDFGYEIPTYSGGQTYETPTLDMLAQNGIQFRQCRSTPNCSPSRVMLMTGKYNFRNYTTWGILDTATNYTIANMLKDAGYKTSVTGKWQLDGGDASIHRFGFDDYYVFLPYAIPGDDETGENTYRYKNPKIYQNGDYLPDSVTYGKYSEDMFAEHISSFIESNLNNPFFIYYPMSLCHQPFSPTPDDPLFETWDPLTNDSNNLMFPAMVKYMDKKIGQLVDKINESGLAENTIILFVGDNGSPNSVKSYQNGVKIKGGKGQSTEYGVHVPLIAYWPSHIIPASASNTLVDFCDFLPTLADIAGTQVPEYYGATDGISFSSAFYDSTITIRNWSYSYWKPANTNKFKVWAQTDHYKLYDSATFKSKFFDIISDPQEKTPVKGNALTTEKQSAKTYLQSVITQMQQP